MNLGDVIAYFKAQATKTGIPYQQLINLYLSQCIEEDKTLTFVQGVANGFLAFVMIPSPQVFGNGK